LRSVVTIGTFDGVHKGHQAIINDVVEKAHELHGESVLVTFDPHPRKLINPNDTLQLITPLKQKIALLEKTGIHHIVVMPFTPTFAAMSAEEYIEAFLVKKFAPAAIVIGYDHRFGHDRKGDLLLLEEAGSRFGFQVIEIPAQKIDEAAVSSTKIRNAIARGDMLLANEMLGRPYELTGAVIHGAKVGRQLGFPTANIQPTDKEQIVPANGVYAIFCTIKGNTYSGMLNIGIRPTVDSSLQLHIEAHIFDFANDIYNEEITISFVEKMREEQRFPSLDALKAQLVLDAQQARKVTNTAT
jgi:riboflavin kinase/FMN adenylyltransferase